MVVDHHALKEGFANMICMRIGVLSVLVGFVAGCAGHTEAFLAENMDRQKFERDLEECGKIADIKVSESRKKDEKLGRRSPLTSGEIVAVRVLGTLLAGNPGRSGVKGADEIAQEECMYDRGYVSQILNDADAAGLEAARAKGTELEFLQQLYRRDFRTKNDPSLPK